MSRFIVLAATEFPQDLPAFFKEEMPDSCVADFAASRRKAHSGNTEGQGEKPQVTQITDQDRIEMLAFCQTAERLEPYWENTENPAYLAFYSASEGIRESYETEGIDCVRMPGGRIIPCYYSDFDRLYELHDGKVYKREYGPLHHRKRTTKAKKILPLPNYPLKKLYPSYGDYMERYRGCVLNKETGEYGIYGNPNAKWDWFEIGGRWPLRFLVKSDCPLVIYGSPSWMFKEPPQREAPEGYRWVTGARKCDIAWDLMRKDAQAHYTEYFREYETWFQKGEIPIKERHRLTINEDGIMARGDYVYRKGETLEAYLDRMGVSDQYQYPLMTFACVDGDGWKSIGDMGYFGVSSDNKDEQVWNKMVEDFIAGQPSEAILIAVDCHI